MTDLLSPNSVTLSRIGEQSPRARGIEHGCVAQVNPAAS